MKQQRSKFLCYFLCLMLAVTSAFCMTACGKANTTPSSSSSEVKELGKGNHQFTFNVQYKDETTESYLIKTDQTTVGAALLELKLIDGEDSAYGLYVKSVNGVVADYDIDQTYWAFFIGDEYASTGVDQTDIVDGTTYSFRVSQ